MDTIQQRMPSWEKQEAAVAVDTILHAIITFRNHCVEQFGDELTFDTRDSFALHDQDALHVWLACCLACLDLPVHVAAPDRGGPLP